MIEETDRQSHPSAMLGEEPGVGMRGLEVPLEVVRPTERPLAPGLVARVLALT